MKILNIDAFATVTRKLSLAGQTYAIEELSVQQFIDNLKAAEQLEKEGASEDVGKSLEQAILVVRQAVPTMPEALVRTLKVPAMTAVLQFIRGELDGEDVAEGAPADTEKKPD